MTRSALARAVLLTVAVMAFFALAVAPAFAGFYPDKYEPDNDMAHAKAMPSVSYHTFTTGDYEDWIKLDITGTNVPVVIETLTNGSLTDSELTVYDHDGTTVLASNDDSDWWDTTLSDSILFRAPHTGRYYIKLEDDDDQQGACWLYINKGIGRRIGGTSYAAVAAAASRLQWSDTNNAEMGIDRGPDSVVVCNSAYPADAVLASAIADREYTTVLFTNKNSLPAATSREINRLLMSYLWEGSETTVYVVGSTSHVSSAVMKKINGLANVSLVQRVKAASDAELSVLVANGNSGAWTNVAVTGKPIFLVNGAKTVEGLLAQTLAGQDRGPLFFVNEHSIPLAVRTTLLAIAPAPTEIYVIGNTSTVDDANVMDWLATNIPGATLTRVTGSNKYVLAKNVADLALGKVWLVNTGMVLVGGSSLVEGAAGVPMSMQMGVPLLFTPRTSLSATVKTYIGDSSDLDGVSYALGSTGAITTHTFDDWRLYYNK